MAVSVTQHCVADVSHASTLAAVFTSDEWPEHCAFGSCHVVNVHKDVSMSMAVEMCTIFIQKLALVCGNCMMQLAEYICACPHASWEKKMLKPM